MKAWKSYLRAEVLGRGSYAPMDARKGGAFLVSWTKRAPLFSLQFRHFAWTPPPLSSHSSFQSLSFSLSLFLSVKTKIHHFLKHNSISPTSLSELNDSTMWVFSKNSYLFFLCSCSWLSCSLVCSLLQIPFFSLFSSEIYCFFGLLCTLFLLFVSYNLTLVFLFLDRFLILCHNCRFQRVSFRFFVVLNLIYLCFLLVTMGFSFFLSVSTS